MLKKQTSIKFKLSYERLLALHSMYEWLLNSKDRFIPANDHEALLHEHAIEFKRILLKKLVAEQLTYLMRLNGTEAMAFYHIWNRVDTSHNQYGNVAICEIIKLIDQTSLNAKIIAHVKAS